MLTPKLPSPDVNPATQLGSNCFGNCTKGLVIGLIFGKLIFKSSDNPKFKDALILIIFSKPSIVKCFFSFINPIAFLKSK